jgi:hypothetical protein
MDYRDLLKRYIVHVTEMEGTSFLHDESGEPDFNTAEWSELLALRDLAYVDMEVRKAERRQKIIDALPPTARLVVPLRKDRTNEVDKT